MIATTGETVTVKVTCKTWRCVACREATKRKVQRRIAYGISTLGQCYFITLTLKLVSGTMTKDARFVSRAWRALLSRLKYQNPSRYKKMAWFKVIELTKRNQPHLHLIVGGLGEVQLKELHADWSQAWLTSTGDSFIVDVRKVIGVKGAAFYLTKYVTKGVLQREVLESKGFLRRWSASANWPRGVVSNRGSEEQVWDAIEFVSNDMYGSERFKVEADTSVGHPLLERVGDGLLLEWERIDIAHGVKSRLKQALKGGKGES